MCLLLLLLYSNTACAAAAAIRQQLLAVVSTEHAGPHSKFPPPTTSNSDLFAVQTPRHPFPQATSCSVHTMCVRDASSKKPTLVLRTEQRQRTGHSYKLAKRQTALCERVWPASMQQRVRTHQTQDRPFPWYIVLTSRTKKKKKENEKKKKSTCKKKKKLICREFPKPPQAAKQQCVSVLLCAAVQRQQFTQSQQRLLILLLRLRACSLPLALRSTRSIALASSVFVYCFSISFFSSSSLSLCS